ncbi:MAG: serine hydrolase [Candidatus Nomurabacteria bacterium]
MKYLWIESIKLKVKKFKVATQIVLVIVIFFVGCLSGYFYEHSKYNNFFKEFRTLRENSSKYSLINPLIGNITPPATEVGIYSDIKDEVESYLKEEEDAGELYGYSFYFRDLNSGLWFGSNESLAFFPASLFKLPVAIAAYKEGEDDHSFLEKKFVYTEALFRQNKELTSNSDSDLVIGDSYSVKDLVEKMLVNSDNGAKDLLLTAVNGDYINKIFETASLVDPELMKTFDISSLRYALFLRILYGSSYLNEEHSQLIMEMLSKSTFKDGLVSGIPADVPIAHKFGAYQFQEKINDKDVVVQQLHDCGVIYHKTDPYIVCFMTKGKNSEDLFRIFSKVSSIIYNYQDKAGD